jgi:hypothetical protein
MAISALVAIASFVIGYIVFTRAEDDFVYYV